MTAYNSIYIIYIIIYIITTHPCFCPRINSSPSSGKASPYTLLPDTSPQGPSQGPQPNVTNTHTHTHTHIHSLCLSVCLSVGPSVRLSVCNGVGPQVSDGDATDMEVPGSSEDQPKDTALPRRDSAMGTLIRYTFCILLNVVELSCTTNLFYCSLVVT